MKTDLHLASEEDAVLTTNETTFSQGIAGVEFQGKVLEPYTAGRMMAADSLGLRFGKFTPEEAEKVDALAKLLQDNPDDEEIDFTPFLYKGVVFDVTMVIFLCSQPRSVSMRALRKPDSVIEEAANWADRVGLTWPSETFSEAYKCFWQLIAANGKATGKFEAQETPGAKKAGKQARSKN